MTIQKISNVHYRVIDVGAAASFYEEALQLPLRFRDGERWAQFSVGGAGFAIGSPEESAQSDGGVVVFESDDQSDHLRLVEGGADLIDDRDMGDHGHVRTYRDPSGNLFQLLWRAE